MFQKSKRKTRNKRKRSRSFKRGCKRRCKQKMKLYYFYMNNCPWCYKFEKTWSQLKRHPKINHIQCIKKNGPQNKVFIKKYKVKTYPSLVKVMQNQYSMYPNDNRTLPLLLKFLL